MRVAVLHERLLPGGQIFGLIAYYQPYATSHEALDQDEAVQEESRNLASAVAKAVVELRAGRLQAIQPALARPRPK